MIDEPVKLLHHVEEEGLPLITTGGEPPNGSPLHETLSALALVKSGDGLEDLVREINEAHDQTEQHFNNAVQHARRAGQLLLEAKKQVTHGDWKKWVKDHCKFSLRTAQTYMVLARRWPELQQKAQRAALS